jgi:hypothetical protein
VLMQARHPEVSAWALLLACGYPVLEVLFSILRRRRRRRSPGDADRLHLHSLVKRRVVRRLLPHASHLVRNSVTGAFMWAAALLPAAIAVNWPTNTPVLVPGFGLCAFLYSAVYARLTQFHWFLSAATPHLKMAKKFSMFRARMSSEAHARAAARAEAMLLEMQLHSIRKTGNVTQFGLAHALDVAQGAFSRLEHREEMYVKTLRGYIRALGGELQFVAKFPDAEINVRNFEPVH